MSKKPQTLDDSRFNQITRDALEGREDEAAQESGIDFEAARELSRRKDAELPTIAAELASALEQREWVCYQSLQGHRVRPVLILQVSIRGLAGVSPEGAVRLSDRFLVAVTLEGKGSPKESRIQVLSDLTPIWHPQVSPLGAIAMIEPPTNWGEAMRSLKRLISYEDYDSEQQLRNPAAAEWARENESLFPLSSERNESDSGPPS